MKRGFDFLRLLLLAFSLLIGLGVSRHSGAQTASLPAKPPQISAAEDIPKPLFEEGKEQKPAPPPASAATTGPPAANAPPEPFGSRLFTGNFLHTRQDGLNPDYVVMPGVIGASPESAIASR